MVQVSERKVENLRRFILKMKKRFLASLLSLVMLLTMLPVTAFAANTLAAGVTTATLTVTATTKAGTDTMADKTVFDTVTVKQDKDGTQEEVTSYKYAISDTNVDKDSVVADTLTWTDKPSDWATIEAPTGKYLVVAVFNGTTNTQIDAWGSVAISSSTNDKEISTVAVTIDTTNLTTTSTLPTANTSTTGANVSTEWYNASDEKVSSFAAAGNYTAKITVTADADSGYSLASNATYTLNGDTETALPADGVISTTATVTAASQTPTEVSAVAVTIVTTDLKVGSTLPQATTETAGVDLTTTWKTSAGATVTEFADAGTYTVEITVAPKANYTLASNVTYTLNGSNATATNNVLSTTAAVEEASQTPTEVTAVAVTIATTNLKVGSTLPQATTETAGVDLTTTWKTSAGATVTEFADAGTYTVEITVAPKANYTLASNVTYTLNGANATATNNVLSTTAAVEEADAPAEPAITGVTSQTTGVTANFANGTITLGGKLKVPTDPATTGTVSLTVTYTDETGASKTKDVTVTLTYDSTAPTTWKLPNPAEVTVEGDLKAILAGNVAVLAADADIPIAELAITLVPAGGIKVGDTLPSAVTSETNVTLTTVWKLGTTTVTKAETAGDYTATITVEAKNGYVLTDTEYKLDGAPIDLTEAVLTKTVKVEAAAAIENNVTVNVTPSEGGTAVAQVDNKDVTKAAEGDSVTIKITPATGYEIQAVTFDGDSVEWTNADTYTFEMPNVPVIVNVVFKQTQTSNPDTTVTENGTVSGTGDVSAIVNPSTTTLNDKIAEAKKDDNKAVTFEVTVPEADEAKAKTANVTLSKAAVKSVSDENLAVIVKTPVATVNVPAATMKKIVADTTTADVKLVVDKPSASDVATTVASVGSFDVKFKDANNKEVKVDSELTLTMKVKGTMKKVWVYLYKGGKASVLGDTDEAYDVVNGEVTFTAPHLTAFVAQEAKDTTAKPETKVELSFETAKNVTGGIVTVTGVEANKLHVIQITKKLSAKEQASVISFAESDQNGVLKFQAQGNSYISVFAPKTTITDPLIVKIDDLTSLKYEWLATATEAK